MPLFDLLNGVESGHTKLWPHLAVNSLFFDLLNGVASGHNKLWQHLAVNPLYTFSKK